MREEFAPTICCDGGNAFSNVNREDCIEKLKVSLPATYFTFRRWRKWINAVIKITQFVTVMIDVCIIRRETLGIQLTSFFFSNLNKRKRR